MNAYDLVKIILRDYPEARDSDNALEWYYMEKMGKTENGYISRDNFIHGPVLETARRSKQTIQNRYHLYEKSAQVKKWTQEKARQKGTHIFREKVTVIDPMTGERLEV